MGVPPKQGCQYQNFRTTHAKRMKFLGKANMKKSSTQTGPSKIQTFYAGNMKWWSTNSQLPHLKQLASKCLCIPPATSASSKWCYLSAGLTLNEQRPQLSGEHLEALNVWVVNSRMQ